VRYRTDGGNESPYAENTQQSTGTIMSKYQTSRPKDDETRSERKKSGKKSKNKGKSDIGENVDYSARQSGQSCGESYKSIWKASIGK
jgi:hypothetical protein